MKKLEKLWNPWTKISLVMVALIAVMMLATATQASADGYYSVDGYVMDTGKAYIEASLDGGKTWSPAGIYINDWRGERIAFTCREFLYPQTAQDENMSASNWKKVEDTKILVRAIVPKETIGRAFSYTLGNDTTGVIASYVTAGTYEFNIVNGEFIIWLEEQTVNANTDLLVRILLQAEDGNFDVKHELAIKWVTPDIYALLPQYFVDERGIKEISYPKPIE